MEEIQPQSSISFNNADDYNRQKIQDTTNETDCSSEEIVPCFENLSNEVIYEIFEYLDYFHVYEAFLNLNRRFYHLLAHSNLPIQINFSSLSKSTLKRFHTDIIQTNMHRISSLHFSNVYMFEVVLSSIGNLSKFSRLKTLILDNIESIYLEHLLNQLTSLSLLSSLVIILLDPVRNKNTIYHQIFRLSALKYCQLSLNAWSSNDTLPVCTNEYSLIEHLIITNDIYPYELDSLLSYILHLRRLSFHLLRKSWNERTKIFSRSLNHLTHISLNIKSIQFDQFEQLFRNLFRNVQVLYLTFHCYNTDPAYMSANKWEQLIISHIPNLRVLDIQFDVDATNNDDQLRIETQINQFSSPFWTERQWFFAYYFYWTTYGKRLIFYSTNPYRYCAITVHIAVIRILYLFCFRRKDYTLYEQSDNNTSLHYSESNLDSVRHVYIQSEKTIINWRKYFPNVIELILKNKNFPIIHGLEVTILNGIIPFKQLTTLRIECSNVSIRKVIEILSHTPNIHTLILQAIPCFKNPNEYTSIKRSEDFQLVSKTNTITNVTCDSECTLEEIILLVALCPRVQHLTIDTWDKNIEPIARFLLDKTNQNTRQLYSLCFSIEYKICSEVLEKMLKFETLVDDYTLKLVGSKLYLWW